jgi:mRNA interferase MazF
VAGDHRAVAGLRRGDIHAARFGRLSGHEQAGARPALVLQAEGMAGWSTVIVAPLSSSARESVFRPRVDLKGTETRVLLESTRALDKGRIGRKLGSLSADEMIDVNIALKKVLGLS